MSSRRNSSLPKTLQDLVDRDEDEMETYGDYENSWTTTEAQPKSQTETDQQSSKTEPSTEGMNQTENKTAEQEDQSSS